MKSQEAIAKFLLIFALSLTTTTVWASAAPMFEETFDTLAPAPDFTSTAAYFNWEFVPSPAGTQSSVDGAANLVFNEPGSGQFDLPRARAVISAGAILGGQASAFDVSDNPWRVQGDVQGINIGGSTPGFYHVGLVLGGLRFIIHPGFNGFSGDGPRGAFAIRTIDDTSLITNQDMGFIPAENEFHTIDVLASDDGSNYAFDVTVGSYADTFSISKSVAGPLNQVGFSISDLNGLEARFDNLSVTPIPEPSTLVIFLALGMLITGRTVLTQYRLPWSRPISR